MRIIISSILFSTGILVGCNEAEVVFECAQPQSIKVSEGLSLEGKLSVKNASGTLDANIGSELSAEFASADPNNWISIASNYQYQTCQFINSTSCDDLSKSECLEKKSELLESSYDKINNQLNAEKAKAEKFEQDVSACISERLAGVISKPFSHPGSVRCPGGGCFLESSSCNNRSLNVSYTAPTNYNISGYSLTRGSMNHGSAGGLSAAKDGSGRVVKLTAPIACSPPDRPGAPGGWSNITLKGTLNHNDPDTLNSQSRQACANEVRAR